MAPKRPLEAVPTEQEGPRSPRKRLRRTVLLMMWLERRSARPVTVEQLAHMVRQFTGLAARLGSMERLLLDLPNIIHRLLAEQLASFQFQRQMSEGFSRVKLRFVDVDRPKDPLFTGCPVKWQNGRNAKVAIFGNDRQITQGDLSKLKIEILAVHADFFTEQGQEDFTKEEFNKQIYMHKGKESVLKTVNLANGEAYIGPFSFTESSQRKRLRLTARVKRQHKVNNWKKSAYKKFDERESSGHLTPDYFMINGRPVRAVPHDAGPSVQEFGDRRPLNGCSQPAVLSNNDAGPSNQETLPFSQPTYEQSVHQGLDQHDPCTSQSVSPYYLAQGNFINDQGQGSFSAEPTIPSHILAPVPEDDPITFTAASLTGQQNGHFSFSTTNAPGTSYPAAVLGAEGVAGTSSDGVSLGTSSPNHVQTDILSGLTPIEFQVWLELQATLVDQDFAQTNSELLNSDSQFHGFEHDRRDR
ncbi:hypothetical protein CFC21_067938 [Triticum aestivum]|uniref:Calmodulin binding protein-like N-terminal domain-containing protein n=3 Tax=Triticum TaxID=4564 RepID=A0A9R1H997_WHEAT|nr:hypothetical protein CFC21_067938 [Triticum aestivum]